MDILGIQNIDDEMKQKLDALFMNTTSFNQNNAFERIEVILNIYKLWVNKENKIKTISFYDAINQGLGSKYDFNQLLRDYRLVSENKNLLIKYEEKLNKNNNDTQICIGNECKIVQRFERDEEKYNQQNDKLNKLYFIFNNNNNENDNEQIIKNIICQQTLDTIHCEFYHTIRIT
eukprot:325715_1